MQPSARFGICSVTSKGDRKGSQQNDDVFGNRLHHRSYWIEPFDAHNRTVVSGPLQERSSDNAEYLVACRPSQLTGPGVPEPRLVHQRCWLQAGLWRASPELECGNLSQLRVDSLDVGLRDPVAVHTNDPL